MFALEVVRYEHPFLSKIEWSYGDTNLEASNVINDISALSVCPCLHFSDKTEVYPHRHKNFLYLTAAKIKSEGPTELLVR